MSKSLRTDDKTEPPNNTQSFYFFNEPVALAFSDFPKSGVFWQSPVLTNDSLKLKGQELVLKDIAQGYLANDYFLAAVTAICSKSQLLSQKCVSEESAGSLKRVGFRLNLKGRWETVWVDPKLPFYLK